MTVAKEKAPYYVIQSQVMLIGGLIGHTAWLRDSPEEGMAETLEEAGVIADRDNGIARLGILGGYLGRKSAKPLIEQIIGKAENGLIQVDLLLVHMDKNDHVHHPGAARMTVYVTRHDDELSVKLGGFADTSESLTEILEKAARALK